LPTEPRARGPVRAVVFDMDGVLIDSEVIWRQVRKDYAAEIGQVWTETDQMDMLGRSTPDWSALMRERLRITHLSAADLAQEILGRVQDAFARDLPQRPGAAAALQALAQRYPMALASGSPRPLVESAMRITGFAPYFRSILCGDDVQHGKPHPEIYLRSLHKLGVEPEQAAGVEDAPNGLRALRAAGMWAVAAPCPEFPLDAASHALGHVHISTLEDLNVALLDALGR
jgi:HAD superfamily hydrolase (TIGR01509 family)